MMETFLTEYRKQLAALIAAEPDKYKRAMLANNVTADGYVEMIANVIRVGGVRRLILDSPSYKATCKALGIKHTYKAMEHFIANHA